MARESWKRCAGLGIGFARKYRDDPFFRTQTHVITLQLVFALFLLVVVALTAMQLYHDASIAVVEGISTALQPHSSPTSVGFSIADELDYTRSRTVSYAIVAVLAITTVFTYIIVRIALAPTRNALQSQKQFIGNVAHELRTPLAIIKANIETRLLDDDVPEKAVALYQANIEELDRISDILNNLLSLSSSIRPERIKFSNVDLGQVVESALDKIKSLAESKELEVQLRMSERRIVWGNAVALEQVVVNIVKNAYTHTGRNGRILITIEPVHPHLMELVVQDTGIGIARKDLFRIFEPYYRGNPSRARSDGGSGLGLTIVSELVKLHNGKIMVRSVEKRGTTVTIMLPAGEAAVGMRGARGEHDIEANEIDVDFSGSNRFMR